MKPYFLFLLCYVFIAFHITLDGQTLSQRGVENSNIRSLSPDKSTTGLSDSIVVKLGAILKVGITSAKSGGSVKAKNLSDIKYVGLCLAAGKIPEISDLNVKGNLDSASFFLSITDLDPGTVYLIRAFAITIRDTIYSSAKAFYTHKPDAVADIDGNYYNYVKIGSQMWLAEDLKTEHLNDGSPIQNVGDEKLWPWIKTPAYCWYANDSVNYSFPRGKLYNWYTVNTGKVCPAGWHVPSDIEWTRLEKFLGEDTTSGAKLKTTGTIFWKSPNQRATNETGFSAIPSGYRNSSGLFSYSTIFDNWWSSDIIPYEGANYWYVYHMTGVLYHEMSYKMFGYSIRCLKN